MSIVRIGLAETKGFSEGYDAIFGKKDDPEKKPEQPSASPEAAKPEEKKEEKK